MQNNNKCPIRVYHISDFCYVFLCFTMFLYVLLWFSMFYYVFAMICYVFVMFRYVFFYQKPVSQKSNMCLSHGCVYQLGHAFACCIFVHAVYSEGAY